MGLERPEHFHTLFLPYYNPSTMNLYCFAHGISNTVKDVFRLVCDQGNKKFSPAMQAAQPNFFDAKIDREFPWAIDQQDMKAVETVASRVLAARRENTNGAGKRAPFFSSVKPVPEPQKDRKMAFWILLSKCPLGKLFLHMTFHSRATEDVVTPIFKWFDVMALCLQCSIVRGELQEINRKLESALNQLESALPKYMSTICFHLLRHIPDQIERAGPMHQSWTFFMERYVHGHRRNI